MPPRNGLDRADSAWEQGSLESFLSYRPILSAVVTSEKITVFFLINSCDRAPNP